MMRTFLLTSLLSVSALAIAGPGCTNQCPEGENAGSLYCHNGNSSDPGDDSESDANNLVCADPNETSCAVGDGTLCVDTDVSDQHCGSCGNECPATQGCAAGVCVDICDQGQVSCEGTCINPLTDGQFCGASGTCTGDEAGTTCGDNQVCTNGTCTVALRYLGSLEPTNGRWAYGGTLGIDGAIAQCQALFIPTATICSYDHLTQAAANGELVNAADSAGTPVTSWFVDDAGDPTRRCVRTDAENIPWTYPTADLGQGSTFVDLNAAAGTISALQTLGPDSVTSCGAIRNVACCDSQ